MSRLIDADALIEAIRSHYENVYCEDAVLNNFYRLAHEHVIDVVNIQKTAFDKEKVVAELEEASRPEIADDMDAFGDIPSIVVSLNTAIDIVKRGGVT